MLVNFVGGFVDLLCHIAGTSPPENFSPKKWYWYDEVGMEKKHVNEAWRYIEEHPSWWISLDPLPNGRKDLALLKNLSDEKHDIYFITNRPHKGAKKASEIWLRTHSDISNPTVLIAEQKGPIAKGLRLTHFIDDRPDNCTDVLTKMGIHTQVYLMTQSYNTDFKDRYIYSAIDVEDMLRKEGLV